MSCSYVAPGLVIAMLMVGCTATRGPERLQDASREHDSGDHDGGDAGSDDPDVCSAEYDRVYAFIEAHRECQGDADCAVVGGCSGIEATPIAAAARDAAQAMVDALTCKSFDGAIIRPACEHGRCVARQTGANCGQPTSRCQRSHELYALECPMPGTSASSSCFQRCAGAEDTSCAADFSCQQTSVLGGLASCEQPRVDAWLCRPAPACEVVLSIESDVQFVPGSVSRRRSVYDHPTTGTAPIMLWAENRSSESKTLRYRDPCPGGPEILGGSNVDIANYDFWGTCAAGVCSSDLPPQERTIAPGERVSLGIAQLNRAPTTCNPAGFPRGEHKLTFTLAEVSGAVVCGPEPLEVIAD